MIVAVIIYLVIMIFFSLSRSEWWRECWKEARKRVQAGQEVWRKVSGVVEGYRRKWREASAEEQFRSSGDTRPRCSQERGSQRWSHRGQTEVVSGAEERRWRKLLLLLLRLELVDRRPWCDQRRADAEWKVREKTMKTGSNGGRWLAVTMLKEKNPLKKT